MKKIIVTAVVVGVAAIAASAQATKLYNTEAKYINQERASKVQTQRVDTLQKAIEKEAIRQSRAAQQKTQAAQAGAASSATSTKKAPAKKANTSKTSKVASKKSDSKETSVLGCIGECIKAAFTGGRLPGESADSYSARQEVQRYAFAQPYK